MERRRSAYAALVGETVEQQIFASLCVFFLALFYFGVQADFILFIVLFFVLIRVCLP
jgi:hypothetical protein